MAESMFYHMRQGWWPKNNRELAEYGIKAYLQNPELLGFNPVKDQKEIDKYKIADFEGDRVKLKETQEDLNEALKAVKILRNQLQEVNLLNAKLLYVNKVFKSNNLSEGQKVNVIAAFDKAETVKEVKLVFETVSKNVVAKPAAIKEHRSFASKATQYSIVVFTFLK
jgi:peptidoglycan hydrolase CwlO-like protein